jgi:predicted MFS family arabinose efflux permease
MASQTTPVGPPPALSSRRWLALAVITLIYSCNFLDRTVVSLVAEPLRAEFGLTDSELGLLTGLAFGLTFAVTGLPMGWLVDRVNRRHMLSCVVLLWSSATAAAGFASSFSMLLLCRMGVGATESGGAPTSMSLISDYFPPQERVTAMGVYYLGNTIGGLMCLGLGAYVAQHHGWRAAFWVAGVPGAVLALVAWMTLPEPVRGGLDAHDTAGGATVGPLAPRPVREALRFLWREPSLRWLYLATGMVSAAAAALGVWLPPFLMREHGLSVGSASAALAAGSGLCGALGALGGGRLADVLARRRPQSRYELAIAMLLLALPCAWGATHVAHTGTAIALTCVTFLLLFSTIPIGMGIMLMLAPPDIRGFNGAVMQVVTNLLAYGIGPMGTGLLSDRLGTGQLGHALGITVCATAALGVLTFRAAQPLPERRARPA